MHLRNWFTSCSPVVESGMWLMNWRLGWTVCIAVSLYIIKRGVNITPPPFHGTLGTSSSHPCSSSIEYVSQLYPLQGNTLTLSSTSSNGYIKQAVSGSDVIRREIERICAGELNGSVTLRYSRYPGCSSNTISLSKLSLGSVSKALVNAPGPREPRYGKGEYMNER